MMPKPTGIIRSPFKSMNEAPRQGRFSDAVGEVLIFEEYKSGLDGLQECSHIILIYWMHKAKRNVLKVIPPGSNECKGVFATRSPHRPNPIGLTVVNLLEIRKNVLVVKGIDAIDKTPLIDIKPFFKDVDCIS